MTQSEPIIVDVSIHNITRGVIRSNWAPNFPEIQSALSCSPSKFTSSTGLVTTPRRGAADGCIRHFDMRLSPITANRIIRQKDSPFSFKFFFITPLLGNATRQAAVSFFFFWQQVPISVYLYRKTPVVFFLFCCCWPKPGRSFSSPSPSWCARWFFDY